MQQNNRDGNENKRGWGFVAKLDHETMRVFALRIKSRFFNREKFDFLLNANALNETFISNIFFGIHSANFALISSFR